MRCHTSTNHTHLQHKDSWGPVSKLDDKRQGHDFDTSVPETFPKA